jgi:hypothetical protein
MVAQENSGTDPAAGGYGCMSKRREEGKMLQKTLLGVICTVLLVGEVRAQSTRTSAEERIMRTHCSWG